MRRSLVVPLLLLMPALAGCLGDDDSGTTPTPDDGDPRRVPPYYGVVVADISPGANLYHEAHQRPDWTQHPCQRVIGLPCDMPALNLTFGDDYAANVAADADIWDAYAEESIHWIPGTNLLLWTTDRPPSNGVAGHGHSFHGSATAGAVNDACPDCYVLVVRDGQSLDGEPIRRIAEELPWVDLVVSTNWPGNGQRTQDFYTDGAYADATKALHETGRLFFGAAGNTPVTAITPVPYPHIMLPPWVVLVGGSHSQCNAGELSAGKPTEFVGDFAQTLPANEHVTDRFGTAGTSFAAPWIAGMFGHALWEIRQLRPGTRDDGSLWSATIGLFGHDSTVITGEDLRAGMAHFARWFEPMDFTPCPTGLLYAGAHPVSPTPWVEMGWGYIGKTEASAAARYFAELDARGERPLEAEIYMDAVMQARELAYAGR